MFGVQTTTIIYDLHTNKEELSCRRPPPCRLPSNPRSPRAYSRDRAGLLRRRPTVNWLAFLYQWEMVKKSQIMTCSPLYAISLSIKMVAGRPDSRVWEFLSLSGMALTRDNSGASPSLFAAGFPQTFRLFLLSLPLFLHLNLFRPHSHLIYSSTVKHALPSCPLLESCVIDYGTVF